MKKVYTFILSLLVGAAVMAADGRPRSGMINISVQNNSAVRVVIDGRSYNDNSVTLSNITPGYHNVQVIGTNTSRNIFDRFGRNREQVLWSNSLYVKAGTETDVTINRNGRANVREIDMPYHSGYNSGSWGNNDHRDNHDRDNGYNNGRYDNNSGRNNNNGYDHRR